MIGQIRCSQIMKCCRHFLGNSRVQVVVLRGSRLLPLKPFTLYVCVFISVVLGSISSKHDFDIPDIVVPVSNKDFLLLLILTGNFMAYFVLLNLTLII